jgi:hypothetical protein
MLLEIDERLYDSPIHRLVRSPTPAMQIPDVYRKSVAFLSYFNHKTSAITPIGTVFFVGIPGEKQPTKFFLYAITAKHIIEGLRRLSAEDCYIRFNLKTGGSKPVKMPLAEWVLHPDPATDVAICLITIAKEYDVEWFTTDNAATPEVIEAECIGIGDEIFLISRL